MLISIYYYVDIDKVIYIKCLFKDKKFIIKW